MSLADVRSGELWLIIGVHFGWNALQGPILQIDVTGTDIAPGEWRLFSFSGSHWWGGGDLGVEGGFAGLAWPIAGLLLICFVTERGDQERGGAYALPR